jgi:hypothetical protein
MATIQIDKDPANNVSGFQNGNTITVHINVTAFMEAEHTSIF